MVLLFTLVTIVGFSQTTSIETKASIWFKKNQVEQTFKDPYSYKLLKVSKSPITIANFRKENYMNNLDVITTRDSSEIKFKENTTYQHLLELDSSMYKKYKKDYDDYMKKGETSYANIVKSTMEFYKSGVERYNEKLKEHKVEEEKRISEVLTKWKEEDEKYQKSKKEFESSTPKDKITISHYLINLDCYANNSYGNPVLGKYQFYYFPNSNSGYSVEKIN